MLSCRNIEGRSKNMALFAILSYLLVAVAVAVIGAVVVIWLWNNKGSIAICAIAVAATILAVYFVPQLGRSML